MPFKASFRHKLSINESDVSQTHLMRQASTVELMSQYSVAIKEAASVSQLRLSLFSSSLCLVEVFGCVVMRFDRYANAFLVSECHLKLSEPR